MKILKYLFLFISVALCSRIFGQINYNATTNTGQYSSAIGDQTKSTNLASFASGFKSEANGKYASAFGEQTKANEWGSFASGYKSEATGQFAHALGLFAKAEYTASIALGKYVRSSSSNAIVLGVGYGTSELVNNYGNTMMIGFNSTKPTFFMSQNETTQPDGLGKIGIGTTTPGSLLQVNGATALGYDAATIAPANGLLVSGNTGIGTTTVGSKLQINGNAAIGYSSSTAAPANGLVIAGNTGIGTANVGSKLQVNGNAAIGYSASTAAPANGLLINGNLGIGTTAATTTEKLTVNGKVKTSALVLPDGEITSAAGLGGWNKSGNNIYNSNIGNVGIGTDNPHSDAKLQVNGNSQLLGGNNKIYAYNDLNNYYIGEYAVSGSSGLDIHWHGGIRLADGSGNGLQISNGNVTIAQNLAVGSGFAVLSNGNVWATQVRVRTTNPYSWPDYVFNDDYKITDLEETALFIKSNKHLPGMPTAKQIEKEGIDLAEMNRLLLEKIEELTLHVIDLNKRIKDLEKNNKSW